MFFLIYLQITGLYFFLVASLELIIFMSAGIFLHGVEFFFNLDGKLALEAFDRMSEGVLVRTSGWDVMIIAGHEASFE